MNIIALPNGFNPKKFKIDDKIMNQNVNTFSTKNSVQISKLELLNEFNNFEKIDFTNFEHQNELLKMFPNWLLDEAYDTDKELFLSMCKYDRKNKTFIAGCFDSSLNLISYKYRHAPWIQGKKWITRQGTSPNSKLFPRIYTDKETIYFLEGHRDALTAVLLGLDFIMIPFAGYRYRDNDSYPLIKELHERNIIFIIEDQCAYKCMRLLAQQLSVTANKIILKQLGSKNKMDLSDYVQKFNSIEEVLHELQN